MLSADFPIKSTLSGTGINDKTIVCEPFNTYFVNRTQTSRKD